MRIRLIGLGVVAVSAAIAVAIVAPRAHGASGSTTPRCTTRDLAVWLGDGPGGASAGHYTYPLEFSNISGHTCHLFGSPGVSAYRRHQLGLPADSGGTPQLVTLAPRQTGHTLVQFTDIGVIDPSVCHPTTAEVLRVYPPGARNYAEVYFEFGACRSKAIRYMDVQPVQPRVGIPGF